MKAYLLIILLAILAIIAWQQANSLNYQVAVRDATIDNLTSQVEDMSQSLAKQEAVISGLLINLETERNKPPVQATPDELARAYQIIAEGISNHLYYVRNPEKQTPETGNTELNWLWATENYPLIQELIDRAYRK